MNSIIQVTRRQFIKIAGFTVGATLYSWNFAKSSAAAVKDYLKERQSAVYLQDTKMPVRKSQENKAVAKAYKEYLHEPNSHLAHHLLHTEYTDRSISLKELRDKGIKLNL